MKNFILTSIKPWWESQDKSSRIIYASIGIALIISIVFSSIVLLKPRYETLYVGLDVNESGQIIEKLKELKVSYQIDNAGTSVKIPRKDLYEIRLRLASEGLPKSASLGYEILDKSNLGMTEFLQKVNYRRALEGEIARSIGSINGVKSARVHIVIPEQRLFKKDKKETTASVVLNLYNKNAISSDQVEGIIYLVSSSVEGLNPNNVTILDSGGYLLSNKYSNSKLGSLSGWQLELQKNVESYLEDKALSIVEPIVGIGRAVVKVSTQLNFKQVEQTIEDYDPDDMSIRSEERITESTITKYEIDKKVQHIIDEIGNIERLWVSVAVDGNVNVVESGNNIVEEYVPRTKDELNHIASMVKGAIGFDPKRDDVFEITNIQFKKDNNNYTSNVVYTEKVKYWSDIILKICFIIIGLIMFFILRKKFAKFIRMKKIESRRKKKIEEIEKRRKEILPELSKEMSVADYVKEVAEENPAIVAKVIKTMISNN